MRYLRSPSAIRTFAWSLDSRWLAALTDQRKLHVWGRDDPWPIATAELDTISQRIAFTTETTIVLWDNLDHQIWQFDPGATQPWELHRVGPRNQFPARVGVGWSAGEYHPSTDVFYASNEHAIVQFSRDDDALSQFPLLEPGRVLLRFGICAHRNLAATNDIPAGAAVFITAIENPRLRLWDLSRIEPVPCPISHPGTLVPYEPPAASAPIFEVEHLGLLVTKICYDASGERVLIAGLRGGEVRVAPTWEPCAAIPGSGTEALAWDISPDGKTVLSGSRDRAVIAYDADTGAERGRYNFNVGRVKELAFAPDGLTAAACGGTKRIAVWDIE